MNITKTTILIPVTSEKAFRGENSGIYTFKVNTDATKIDVINTFFAKFGKKPVSARVINVEGKATRFGRREGRKSDYKKAVVTLKKGETINLHE
jgi:large subunit ribosomal protein L23